MECRSGKQRVKHILSVPWMTSTYFLFQSGQAITISNVTKLDIDKLWKYLQKRASSPIVTELVSQHSYYEWISIHIEIMMTSSNGNIFRVTGLLYGEFTGEFHAQRPVTLSFDVTFDLCLNKRLIKQ